MEPLRLDDPRQLGPYHVLGRLDSEYSAIPVPGRRYIAREVSGSRTVVVTVPPAAVAEDPRYGARFLTEAENARRLPQTLRLPWCRPVDEIGGGAGAGLPWHAAPYLPALPLVSVVDLHGGPLPERTVRALGAAVAETLAALHEAGLAHAGVAPGAVLVAGDGPRLTGFGDVRAAAEDGAPRTGAPGIVMEFLPPEQAAGGRPRPLGDVFALGAVLAWAATGRAAPEPELLPEGLRDIVLSCRASDPAHRPTAGAVRDALLQEARQQTAGSGAGAPAATSLDATSDRAAGVLGPEWLPGRVIAGIVAQSAGVLAAEVETGESEATAGVLAPRRGTALDGAAHPATQLSSQGAGRDDTTKGAARPGFPDAPVDTAPVVGAASDRGDSSRRALLLGAAAGVAGLAVGGGAVWAATAPSEHKPTAAERLMAAHRTRRRLKGASPQPRWRHDLKGAPVHAPYIWRNRIVVLTGRTETVGLDLRTGRRLWTQETVRPTGPAVPVDDELILIPSRSVAVVAARTGEIAWQDKRYGRTGRLPFERQLGVDGSSVWFAAASSRGERVVVAYDLDHREESWRSPLSAEAGGGQLTDDALIVTAAADPKSADDEVLTSFAFARKDGAERDAVTYQGAAAGAPAVVDGEGMLLVAAGKYLRGYDLSAGGKAKWSVRAVRGAAGEKVPVFGPVAVHGGKAYAADGGYAVHALETATGDIVWQRQYGFQLPERPTAPDVVVSPSGDTLVVADDYEVDAVDARDGTLRWRFADLRDSDGVPGGPARRRAAVTDDTVVVLSGRAVYGLPAA
ncbi:PQQ-binding-like beta-propeller repeat protein [Streptomyces sp. NPDC053560]|uniref:outer membrane protein assembly factor BamB family protein n=1 Tax=Streptomyces sp. NPDC053560 TaxID=3365711 RepID=UPI0037D2C423